jgi:4-amino-4-deoxy-L-arabinose transferase-like glycosyltransferase
MRLPTSDDPRRAPALLVLFVGVSLLTRWLSLAVDVLDMDEAAHAVGSWVLLDGGRLYRDFVDNKPPLLYAYYALAQAPLGRGLLPVHLVTVLVTVPLTALAASAVFRHGRRGLAAGLLHLLFGSAFLAHDMLAANAELILLLPASWAVAALADEERGGRTRNARLAGVLLGVATLVKQQAVFWLPALAVGAVAGRRRAPWALVALAGGFLLPVALTVLGFSASGTAWDLFYWTVLRNVAYVENPISAREALERGARTLLPWLLASAPLLWAWWWSRPLLEPRLRRLLGLLIGLALLPAFAGLRFFPHYLVPCGFALAVAAAPAAERWLARPLAGPGRLFAASTLAIVVVFQALNAALYLGGWAVYRENDPVYRKTAARLARDPCFPKSRLFVWGWAPAFDYFAGLAGTRPATRFTAMAQSGLTGYVAGNLGSVRRRLPGEADLLPAHWDWLMEDLERSRATYILDTAPAGILRWDRYPIADYPRLHGYLRERYALLDSVDGVAVFRRLGCEARLGPSR